MGVAKFFRNLSYDFRRNRALLVMILPVVVYLIIFSYVPMAGAVIAFKSYNFNDGIFGSPWCGLNNFRFFFMSGKAWQVTKNTVLYNAAFIVTQNILEIAAAIFLSEIAKPRFKKITQGAMFLPNFISWVVVGAIAYNLLSYDFGFINNVLTSMGMERWDVYTDASYWPGIFIFLSAWKHIGYGSIVYLAAIMGISSEIYESASLDGANEWQKIRYITLPGIKPTFVVLLILAIGNIFRGNFDMFYQLVGTNGLLYNATDVIDTYVFRSLLTTYEFGMSTAIGLYQSVLCCVTLLVTNAVIRRINPENALY